MNPTLLAFALCLIGAVLEGALAGGRVRARFAELRLPSGSPPLPVWFAIGIAYYVICFFVSRRLFLAGFAKDESRLALLLLVVLMLANAAWGLVFFRWRNLRWSFLAFFPYGVVVLLLDIVLLRVDGLAALLLLPYLLYLIYATWWGYQLWRLNAIPPANRAINSR